MTSIDTKIVKEIITNGVTKDMLLKGKVKDIHVNRIIEVIEELKMTDKVIKKI